MFFDLQINNGQGYMLADQVQVQIGEPIQAHPMDIRRVPTPRGAFLEDARSRWSWFWCGQRATLCGIVPASSKLVDVEYWYSRTGAETEYARSRCRSERSVRKDSDTINLNGK